MGDRSKIEWTDASWTPIRARHRATGKLGWHCEHVTAGCEHCYSEALNKRLGTGLPFKPGHHADVEIVLDETMLLVPLRWRRPRMIFVCSMTDLFADFVPDAMIDRVFAVMALAPHHTFQVLTKRSARMRAYCNDLGTPRRIYETACDMAIDLDLELDVILIAPGVDPALALPGPRIFLDIWPLPNVWLGVSAEDQVRADERIPELLATPAAVRFVSAEPLLGSIDFTRICLLPKVAGSARAGIHINALVGRYVESGMRYIGEWDINAPYPDDAPTVRLDQIITGGESGPRARQTLRSSYLSARDQCAAAGTAYFHKQNGEWIDADEWLAMMRRHGFEAPVDTELSSPLNLEDAAQLACGRPIAHQSDGSTLIRVGKRDAGRLLDGVEHNGMPAMAEAGR